MQMSLLPAEHHMESELSEGNYEQVALLRNQLGRKFEVDDIVNGEYREALEEIAEKFISTYTGRFEFLQDVSRSYFKYGNLSTAQVKGVLNCIVAEWNRRPKPEPEHEEFQLPDWSIPSGTYTLVRLDRENRTLRIKSMDQEHCERYHKAPGTRMVMFLSGPDNTRDYTLCAWLSPTGVVQMRGPYRDYSALADDIRTLINLDSSEAFKAGTAYALASGRCCICGRELTVASSIEAGMGPKCMARFNM